MSEHLTFFAVSGSLRKGSFNTSLLRTAAEVAPPGIEIQPFERIGELPIYNEDLDTDDPAEPVADLRRRIVAADAVLIATPEYNYSIPGGLKNLIDWASRPYPHHSLRRKPVAAMGASVGFF